MKWLLPLSWVYGAGVAFHRRVRIADRPRTAQPHIVSVGNLEAGGNGKTPLAMWILDHAAARGRAGAYVSRGYGGGAVARETVTCVLAARSVPTSLAGMRVLSRTHPELARAVGDEGALVCARVPSTSAFFCRDKARAVRAALEAGADMIVLDDAFQSWRVARHVDIVLLDAERPLDAGALLPAGRLREPPRALRRADAIVMNGAATPAAIAKAREEVARFCRPDVAVAGMARRVRIEAASGGEGARPVSFVAVSGIAKPAAFERSLRDAGVQLVAHEIFRDHHAYGASDIRRITAAVEHTGAPALITTAKDWVKLRSFVLPVPVWIAHLDVSLFGDELPL